MTALGLILVVEDDADIRESMTEVLAGEGYRVAAAADGEEALEHLRHRELPALILLDLLMPRLNGYDFRRAQLADSAWARIPTAILTAHGDFQSMARELGAAAAIRKPVKIEALLEVIGRFLP